MNSDTCKLQKSENPPIRQTFHQYFASDSHEFKKLLDNARFL